MPVVQSAADAEALLYQNAARVRDRFIRDVWNCRFTYAYAGWPTDQNNGWTVQSNMVMRGERLSPSNWSGIPDAADDVADRMRQLTSGIDYDPVEWFGAEYWRFVDGEPRGTYVGQFTYLRQPSLRYETRSEHGEHTGDTVATVLQIDYLLENPYVFIENEYSVYADGTRRLERQFTQHRYELTGCTEGGTHDENAVAVRRELVERAAERYASIRDGAFAGCDLAITRDSVHWVDWRGDAYPDGPIEGEGRSVVTRDAEGLWRVTGEWVARQKGGIVYGTRRTLDGTWSFVPHDGEWRKESSDVSSPYENPLEYLTDEIPAISSGTVGDGGRSLLDQQGFPHITDDGRFLSYRYTGKIEINGRAAVRYEKASVSAGGVYVGEDLDLGQEGLEFSWDVYELFEDNPLLSRSTWYRILPSGELEPYFEKTITEIEPRNCPGEEEKAAPPSQASARVPRLTIHWTGLLGVSLLSALLG